MEEKKETKELKSKAYFLRALKNYRTKDGVREKLNEKAKLYQRFKLERNIFLKILLDD